jgi:uncharacterized Zn finger protein (UPF0148 family)
LCPDAGCATVHGQDVFCPQTERTLHIVLSDESFVESSGKKYLLHKPSLLPDDRNLKKLIQEHSNAFTALSLLTVKRRIAQEVRTQKWYNSRSKMAESKQKRK